MKRLYSFVLVGLILTALLGCDVRKSEDAVLFYYRKTNISTSGGDTGVIAPEARDVSVSRDDLEHLLTLYFLGPLEAGLQSPFVDGTTVADIERLPDMLVITLDSTSQQTQGLEWTVACTCLAKTCFELADVASVQVKIPSDNDSPGISTEICRENIILSDGIPSSTETAQ